MIKITFRSHIPTYPGIPLVHNLKILGVVWADNLTWDDHFQSIIKLCSQRLYVIRRLKSFLPKPKLVIVYNSLIASLLTYASPLFCHRTHTVSSKIRRLIRRAHNIICYYNCNCDLLPDIEKRFRKLAFSFLLKCECPLHPLNCSVPCRLPHSGHFKINFARTSKRQHSFFARTCCEYNLHKLSQRP